MNTYAVLNRTGDEFSGANDVTVQKLDAGTTWAELEAECMKLAPKPLEHPISQAYDYGWEAGVRGAFAFLANNFPRLPTRPE